jgi:hypothetical protein
VCLKTDLGDKVKEALTEVKMSVMHKRPEEDNEKKTYQSTDRVTVLGLVCEKMTERVVLARQEEEDRRVREEVSSITQDDTSDKEDLEDDEGFERPTSPRIVTSKQHRKHVWMWTIVLLIFIHEQPILHLIVPTWWSESFKNASSRGPITKGKGIISRILKRILKQKPGRSRIFH